MSLNKTTLSAACGVNDTSITLASTTGISAPAFPTGPVTYIVVENELMIVNAFSGVSGSAVGVTRGQNGTKQLAHGNTSPVLVFYATDYGSLYNQGNVQAGFNVSFGQIIGAPVASATVLAPSVWGVGTAFHVTGTTQSTSISIPAGVLQTQVTVIADSTWTWATGGASGSAFLASSTATQTGIATTFILDAKAGVWVPSHL